MQITYEIVIADTTCFILLDKISELNLLKLLFGSVVTTTVIALEFGGTLPEWVRIKEVKDVVFQATLDVDRGEASAIALAIESLPSLIVLDDDKARKKARKLQLNVTGTLGLFLKAKREGIIPDVRSMLNKVQETNFHYSENVFNEILKLAGE
jgi:predicted nucleic acid-binding protein